MEHGSWLAEGKAVTKVSADRGFPKVASCSPWDTDSGIGFATRIHVSDANGIHICGQKRKRGNRRGQRETTSLDLLGKSRAGIIFGLASTRLTWISSYTMLSINHSNHSASTEGYDGSTGHLSNYWRGSKVGMPVYGIISCYRNKAFIKMLFSQITVFLEIFLEDCWLDGVLASVYLKDFSNKTWLLIDSITLEIWWD